MTQEEYLAQKNEEPGTPQAPELGAVPETPPVKVEEPLQLPGVDHLPINVQEPIIPPLPPEKTPEQRAQEDAAEYRRKLQQAEARENLIQQQLQFQQQQLQQMQSQQNIQQQPVQQQEIPEFEDPKDTIRWLQAENARQRKVDLDAMEQRFEQKALKTEREQAAGRIMSSYSDMSNPASLLHQQFTQDCYQQGINPQTAAPFQLEAIAAMAAQKCGILPNSVQPSVQARQPLQTARPGLPAFQRPAGPKPVETLPQLTQRQVNWSKQLGRDPKKVQEFMKANEAKYVRSDGTPLYGRSNQS